MADAMRRRLHLKLGMLVHTNTEAVQWNKALARVEAALGMTPVNAEALAASLGASLDDDLRDKPLLWFVPNPCPRCWLRKYVTREGLDRLNSPDGQNQVGCLRCCLVQRTA